MNVINILKNRGFIENTTNDEEIEKLFLSKGISCYIGFDPTASSLHIGSLVPIMALVHMQRAGHKPIALVGGGTGLIGDPSGKTEMRKVLNEKTIEENKKCLKKQLSFFIDFNKENAGKLLDNADWLVGLEYIPFLRDIGKHFSVNKMVKAESYKVRLDSNEGLNFIEFNYMLLQAYDFLKLSENNSCFVQMGGSDQWGNIVAGIDLIRRVRGKSAYGITFPLITTSSGAKMGKTAKGAVWLDKERTSPYDYYQFWINTDDQDVVKFLSLFTLIPMEEIDLIKSIKGGELNAAKTILAFEATKIAHGEKEAINSFNATTKMFGIKNIPKDILKTSSIHNINTTINIDKEDSIPHYKISSEIITNGIKLSELLFLAGLVKSKSEGRRLIKQGGAYINNEKIDDIDFIFKKKFFISHKNIVLRAGKKRYCYIKQ